MTDLLISTPEELRAFLPSHTYRNLDTVRGFLVNAQNTFLRQRIGQPLITQLLEWYTELKPIVPYPQEPDDANHELLHDDPRVRLILLCQRCIVYDAFSRSADIRALTDNDMGMNVAESDNFDSANDKRVERYKTQLQKEAHAATDMLLIQLEEWEEEIGNPDSSLIPSPSPLLKVIVDLFQLSPTHSLCDGLLLQTAVEFQRYVDIYESRDRFIQLLPDIRYCQELHLEAEIGPDLLAYLHQGHRAGTLTPEEKKAYQMLQRTLSLYVEARAKMFSRKPEARDEACGYMALTKKYIADHGICIPPADAAPDDAQQGDNSSLLTPHSSLIEGYHNPTHHHHGIIAPPQPSCNGRPHSPSECGGTANSEECGVRSEEYGSGFLTTSMI